MSSQQQQANSKPQQPSRSQSKSQAPQQQNSEGQQQDENFEPAFSEDEQAQERSKAANQSLEAKKKARYYMRAAAGAGDSKERQKLLKEALNKEVEAESFGKMAKWLNSGALQGFAAGSIPAASLGALTGTLVGGVTSLITGGLGAGIGYLKGPAYSVGGAAASGLQKVTGDWLEWNPDATPEQQQAFEHMCGQIQDEDMPDDEELEMFSAGEWSTGDGIKQGLNEMHDGRGKPTQSWSSYAASWVPGQQAMESVPGYKRMKGSGQDQKASAGKKAQEQGGQPSEAAARAKAQGSRGQSEAMNEKMRSRSQQFGTAAQGLQQRVDSKAPPTQRGSTQGRTNPPKSQPGNKTAAARQSTPGANANQSKPSASSQSSAPKPKGKPRKLERRS